MSDNGSQGDPRSRSAESNRNTTPQGTVLSAEQEAERHAWEDRLNGDELAHLPFLDPGATLEQGRSYLDLNQLNGGPFSPSATREVAEGDRILAQPDVDPEVWRKLVGE